jgi:clan AA aspartic protease (TIGR02281 family)
VDVVEINFEPVCALQNNPRRSPMFQRNDAKHALLGYPAAAGIVAQLCLASAAWSQSPPAATLEKSAFVANAWSALDRDVYEQAGIEWAKRGRHDLAVAWLSEAIMLDPTDSQAYYDRGNSWFLLADYGKAINDYSAEIRIAGDHARSYYQRGLAYEKLGQPEKALVDFQRRLGEAPADLAADSAVARILATLTAKWSNAGLGQIHVIQVASESGDFVVPVVVNGEITLNFIVDSGAADVSIPSDVASTLARTGSLKPADMTGEEAYQLANGSEMFSKTFTLRSLKVGDIVVENVRATIAPPEGRLLLGQTFLKRFNAWSIDNANRLLLLR